MPAIREGTDFDRAFRMIASDLDECRRAIEGGNYTRAAGCAREVKNAGRRIERALLELSDPAKYAACPNK